MRSLAMTLDAFGALGLGVLRRARGSGRQAEPVHDDRHHALGDAPEQPDQRQPAVLAAGRGDAAVGHGRRAARRRPGRVPLRMPDTTRHEAEPRGVPRADADADRRRPEELHEAALLRHDRRRLGRRRPSRSIRRRAPTQTVDRAASRTGVASATPPAHIAIGPLTKRWRTSGEDGARCSIYHVAVDNPAPTRKLVSVHAAAGDVRRRQRDPRLPDGADARGARAAASRCPT